MMLVYYLFIYHPHKNPWPAFFNHFFSIPPSLLFNLFNLNDFFFNIKLMFVICFAE